jgi:hypothetical protein
MSSSELSLIIIPPLCAAIGYMGKYFVDKIERAKEDRKTRKLKLIEIKLKNFFYPFYSNLKRERLIYQLILSFFKDKNAKNNDLDETLYHKIFWGLDNEIIRIYNENQELIKKNFVEMHFSNKLAKLICNYEEHISIYRILRNVIPKNNSGLEDILWPTDLGSSYPKDLFETIESEMVHLQNQQTYILQGHNIEKTHNHFKQFQYRQVQFKQQNDESTIENIANIV